MTQIPNIAAIATAKVSTPLPMDSPGLDAPVVSAGKAQSQGITGGPKPVLPAPTLTQGIQLTKSALKDIDMIRTSAASQKIDMATTDRLKDLGVKLGFVHAAADKHIGISGELATNLATMARSAVAGADALKSMPSSTPAKVSSFINELTDKSRITAESALYALEQRMRELDPKVTGPYL